MARKKPQFIIGIDEAGRGPLAGPVVVGGIRIATRNKRQAARMLRGIRDSKKLSAKQREAWFVKLTNNPKIAWVATRVRPKTIDRINISRAANLGARRVHRALSTNNKSAANERIRTSAKNSLFVDAKTLLDGGLRLPAYIPHKTIIKGDEKIPVIAAASIIAKAIRDRLMLRLHKKYSQYRFDIHKGYGTALHRVLLKKYGRSEVHRRSFRM